MFAPFQVNKQTAISSRPPNWTTIFLPVFYVFIFVYLSKTKDFIFCSHACVFAQNDNRKSKVNSNVFVLPMVSVLCARLHKFFRDLRLLRFQAMICKSHAVAYLWACFLFVFLFLPVMFSPSRNGYRRTCSNQDGTNLLHAGKKTLYIPIKYHYPTSHKVIKSKPNLIVEKARNIQKIYSCRLAVHRSNISKYDIQNDYED